VGIQKKQWLIKEQNPQLTKTFSQSLNISPIIAQLLINRGLTTVEQADYFLSATLKDLYSPFLMKDMDRAVHRIITALNKQEKICIYGDYDVDGITATAILILFLRELGADVFFFLPDRLQEGYGLDIEALNNIRNQGTSLLISVDCGISDCAAVQHAQETNLNIIITDHHQPPAILPPAHAILNPKQPGCAFPFKELAGVGVAFNLIMALRKTLREHGHWGHDQVPNLRQYLDLVALGTVGDIVPLIDENRILVKIGLEVLSKSDRAGIRALKGVSAVPEGSATGDMVTYRLAPRINACGRISTATTAVQLLLTGDHLEAQRLAKLLNEENSRRQQIEKVITAEARTMLNNDESRTMPIILSSPRWHPGVIGICASRLVEEYYRPTVLIAIDKKTGECRGSARSIQGFDLYSALKQCEAELMAFGGHKYAAGLSIAAGGIPAFAKKFNQIVNDALCTTECTPSMEIDAQIPLSMLTNDLIEDMEKLAPFGACNPEPVFCSNDLKYFSAMVVGSGHLKLRIKEDGCFYDAIGFNMATRHNANDEEIRLAFVPQFNEWQGIKSIQLKLKDIQACRNAAP
jgi:single-stranded-DNA-specific exonuclease